MTQTIMQKKNIAFFLPKEWPLANIKVADAFGKKFKDCEVDFFIIESIVFRRKDVLFLNLIATLACYGIEILKGNKEFKKCFWRTPYIFNFVKKWTRYASGKKKYWFTFQIQSIFDCSIEGIPHFVYTDHTHLANLEYESFKKEKLYPQYWIELEKTIYKNSAITFVRSTNIKKSLQEQYGIPNKKVICVFAGSNVESTTVFKPKTRQNKQNILFVGIEWERKGGPALVSAFKKIQVYYPNASLTVVGCKPNIISNNIVIVGKITPEALKQYYINASIFCLPTKEEPFGVVFLEAMQAGLPIIGTNLGAIPDFIKDGWNGWLVDPDDVDGIANAITSLLANPELSQLFGSRSYQLSQENYNWPAVINKLQRYILDYLS